MAITYEWSMTGVKTATSGEIDNAIIGTRWKVVGTDENGNTGEFVGATPFELSSIDTNNFIEYHSLDEENVLNWVKNHVSGSNRTTNYWAHISGQIQKQITNSNLTVSEISVESLPWSPTSGSVTPLFDNAVVPPDPS